MPAMTMMRGLFSADQVRRLTGLSEHQLRYWDNTAFFSPWRLDTGPHRPYNRIYSYRDLVGLRAVAILRNSHRIPLQELRKVGKWLSERCDTPWSSLSFLSPEGRLCLRYPMAHSWQVVRLARPYTDS